MKFPIETIVVPVDFSDESLAAVDAALDMAVKPSGIYVVHVIPHLASTVPYAAWADDDVARLRAADEALEEQLAAETYQGIQIRTVIGDPGDSIATVAQEVGAGLIVMPSHGRTGLKHLLIGSVAERVVRLAHCPVLVLKR